MTKQDQEISDAKIVKAKTVGGALSYFARTLFLQGLGFAANLILSVYLTASDFGVYGVVLQIIGILVFFSDIGLAAALIQKKDEPSDKEYATVFTLQFALAWLIVILALVVSIPLDIAGKYGNDGLYILLALALSFPLAALKTIPSIQLERRLDFSKLVIPQIVEQIVFNAVLISGLVMGYGLLSYPFAILARSISGWLTMLLVNTWWPHFWWDTQILRKLLGFGINMQLNDLLARIKDNLFFLVLGNWFLPPTQFGYIQWAKTWSMFPYNLTVQNVMGLTFPAFSRLQKNKAALREAIELSLFFVTAIIFPLLVGLAFFVPPLTELIPSYTKWQPALLSLGLFSFSIGWSAVSTPLINALLALGHAAVSRNLMIFWTILTWTLVPVCVYFWGFNGVAIGAALIAVTSLIPARLLQREVPFSLAQPVFRQLIAAGVMVVFAWLGQSFWSTSFVWFFTGGVASVLVYMIAFFVIGREYAVKMWKTLRE